MPSPTTIAATITAAGQLVRDELAELQRLGIDRRTASARMPRVQRSALARDPSADGANELRRPPATRRDRQAT